MTKSSAAWGKIPCLLAGLLLSSGAASTGAQPTVSSDMQAFQRGFRQTVYSDAGHLVSGYGSLHWLYAKRQGMEQRQAAQLMSMLDAMLGHHQDAENDYYTAFPSGRTAGECPLSSATVEPALDAIEQIVRDNTLVLFNESHSIIATRALIVRLLPVLRRAGFNYLALEALAPTADDPASTSALKALHDADLPARGYPLDHSDAGVYLREPVYAELIREALAHGFTLIAYETISFTSREERESGQAAALAELITSAPDAKIAVLAGYSHIWKSDGWMAERLQEITGRALVSIDQTSRMAGCDGHISTDSAPFVLRTADGTLWASMPERVDVTIVHPQRADARTKRDGWLTLGGLRKAVTPETSACANTWPCLVSAVYVDEEDSAVPADRVMLTGSDDVSLLFLRPGRYRYRVEAGVNAATVQTLTVD